MTGQERREAIYRKIETAGRAGVGELAKALSVTPATIRNDLSKLEGDGKVVRLHGAVVLSRHAAAERAFAERRDRNGDVKALIGAAAAAFVDDGDAIILDSGTTTLEIARRIKDRVQLVVATNGLDIAAELAHAPGIELLMLGGRSRPAARSFSGPWAEAALASLRFDKLFLGVDALDARHGVLAEAEGEARLSLAMIAAANEIVAVADSTKAGRRGSFAVAPFETLDRLVSDEGLPKAYRVSARHAGVDLVLVGEADADRPDMSPPKDRIR